MPSEMTASWYNIPTYGRYGVSICRLAASFRGKSPRHMVPHHETDEGVARHTGVITHINVGLPVTWSLGEELS